MKKASAFSELWEEAVARMLCQCLARNRHVSRGRNTINPAVATHEAFI